MLNPVLSDLSLTIEQVKSIENELNKHSSINNKDMLVLLVENSGQIIATNGKNTKNYDLSSIAALSVASYESTKALSKAMGQEFKYIFNQGTSSNLFITRATEQTFLVIDYDKSIELDDVKKVVKIFSDELNKLSASWTVLDKNSNSHDNRPLSAKELNKDVENMFDKLGLS
jgi:predicted regulator of Ras-like GTPase activity (Roadblock/LC7/MglB family)